MIAANLEIKFKTLTIIFWKLRWWLKVVKQGDTGLTVVNFLRSLSLSLSQGILMILIKPYNQHNKK